MHWRRGKQRERDLERELRSDLQLETEEQRANGLSAEEAHYAALRAFGNTTFVKEEVRKMWGWTSMERLMQDLRFAARVLIKSPGFTAVAVLSLALGIGANASMFSILDNVLLKSLAAKDPSQLRIFMWDRHGDPAGVKSHSGYGITDDAGRHVDGSFSYPAYELFCKLPQFSDVVAFAQSQFTVTANEASDIAFGNYVSGNYFSGVGAQPLIGRSILPEDDAPSSPRVAVLTHLFWSKRFGSDPGVVGRVIQVNRQPVTVVGVMPPAFQGLQPGRAVDLFVPMRMVSEVYYKLDAPDYWWVQVFGRLKPGVSEEAATAAVQASLTNQMKLYAGEGAVKSSRLEVVLEPGNRGVALFRGSSKTTIYILTGAALLVLLIACLNLANLLLARYTARGKEIAVRVSIGASRWRLLRQMLTESLLLAAIGAAGGLLVAKVTIPLLLDFFAGTSTLGLDPHIDGRALAFTTAAAIATALLFGTLPAWRATRINAAPALKESSGAAGIGGPRLSIGRYLVALQVSLSLLLVVGTGLFLRTLLNLAAIDLGFQTDRLLTFQTDPEKSGYKHDDAARIYRRLQERLEQIPGVQAVGISQLPLIGGVVTNGGVLLPGDPQRRQTYFLDCSDSFLETAGIPVVVGRDLNRADFDHAVRSAVVNETFVKKYLPRTNPIGQIFEPPDWEGKGGAPEPFTIVGVAKDAHYRGVRDEVPPTAYVPFSARPPGDSRMVFMVRTRIEPLNLVAAVRKAVASVDANLPVAEVRTERDQIERSMGTERMFATLVTAFGAMALILAAVGLYGVMAFSVARRTSEIGIRVALGARSSNVQWLVLRQSLFLTLLGVIVGVPCALALTGLVKKLLFGIKPNDPVSLAGAVVVMLAVAACAAWIPARRAARVDPMVALRHE